VTRTARLLCAASLLAAAGCASVGAPGRRTRLETALDGVRVERPLDEVWGAARHVLGEGGYALAGRDAEAEGQSDLGMLSYLSRAAETAATPTGGRRLETGWDGRRVRYRAEAIPDGGGWRVRYTAIHEHLTEHGHDGWSERDPVLELELLRRLAPELAAVVQERAGAAPEER
jgi:hypothetical protein